MDQKWESTLKLLWDPRDPKVDEFPLMNNPLPTIVLSVLYLLVCSVIGPRYMQNRKPFDLRKMILFFNVVMVAANLNLYQKMWSLAWGNNYNWLCEPFDQKTVNPTTLKIAQTIWLYYICKHFDWIDTLFFILRKKFSHVSSLHLYHHAMMPINSWLLLRYMPGGTPTFFVFLNTGVHVIMHTYYSLAALGPKYQKYLWWKKYLTILQLVQFAAIFIQATYALVVADCGFEIPIGFKYYFISQVIVIFLLFARFYINTYVKISSSEKSTYSIKIKAK